MKKLITLLSFALTSIPLTLPAAILINDGDFSSWSFSAAGTATATRERSDGNPGARLNVAKVSGPPALGTAIKTDVSTTNPLASAYFSLYDNFRLELADLPTDPRVPLECTSTGTVTLPNVSGPFMDLVSDGRAGNGVFFDNGYLFNSDSGFIYKKVLGGYELLDSNPRRVFTQPDGSEVMLFEFTSLSFDLAGAIVTGSRAAALLATGNIYLNGVISVDASGDLGGQGGGLGHYAGTNALAPLGGGGAIGTADLYLSLGCCPSYLPTSGAGGGGFVSPGTPGLPATPVGIYNPTLVGYLNRPGGAGGLAYGNFAVLRGGGGGGGNSSYGDSAGGERGGHGGGALLLSTPGSILITTNSTIRADGAAYERFLSEIAAGGAGGYLVLNGGRGILNQGLISAVGGRGRKRSDSNYSSSWGSAGDGSGGLIVLKSSTGVTNTGVLRTWGGAGSTDMCTAGAVQAHAPFVVTIGPRLSAPTREAHQVTFAFTTLSNAVYQVQRNDDLRSTNWVTVTNVLGNGRSTNIIVPASGAPKRFFRVWAE